MKAFIYYPLVVSSIFVYYFISAYIGCKNNTDSTHWLNSKWFWITFIYGALCPLWTIVSKISNNILFDAILYDITVMVSFTIGIIYFTSSKFTIYQYIGIILIIIGLIIFRKTH